jgi:hypothetical protein
MAHKGVLGAVCVVVFCCAGTLVPAQATAPVVYPSASGIATGDGAQAVSVVAHCPNRTTPTGGGLRSADRGQTSLTQLYPDTSSFTATVMTFGTSDKIHVTSKAACLANSLGTINVHTSAPTTVNSHDNPTVTGRLRHRREPPRRRRLDDGHCQLHAPDGIASERQP